MDKKEKAPARAEDRDYYSAYGYKCGMYKRKLLNFMQRDDFVTDKCSEKIDLLPFVQLRRNCLIGKERIAIVNQYRLLRHLRYYLHKVVNVRYALGIKIRNSFPTLLYLDLHQ